MCDRRTAARVKGKKYKVAVRPAPMFGLDHEQTGGRVRGVRAGDVKVFIRSDQEINQREGWRSRDEMVWKMCRAGTVNISDK